MAVAVGVPVSTGLGQSAASPATATRFSLTINGKEIAAFSELSGITSEVEPAEYVASNDKGVGVTKSAGKLKPVKVTLKRGLTGGTELWAWHDAARLGQMNVARQSGSLTAHNAAGEPVAKWWLDNAWLSKLEVGQMKAGSSFTTETVTFVVERLERLPPK